MPSFDSSPGKSLRAHRELPNAYTKIPGKWWDGYKYGQSVIFDDFNHDDFALQYILNLTDHYPFSVEVSVICDEVTG